MKIGIVGIFDPEYNRNQMIIKGLELNNIDFFICNDRSAGIRKYFVIAKKVWQNRKKFDSILILYPGHLVVPIVKLFYRKRIIFDAFTSVYDSNVGDRKNTKSKSVKAICFWFLDWLSCKLSDIIILDTKAHIDFFKKAFKLKKSNFINLYVGADEDRLKEKKAKNKNKEFIVHYHGSFIPLQGLEYIIAAAKLLENDSEIRFNIIGTRNKNKYEDKEFKNITFLDNLSYRDLGEKIQEADICLGIFGNTFKANRVIPNKVFEAIALGKPVITMDSEAIREIFTDSENIILVPSADPSSLAKKIKVLKDDNTLREKLSKNSLDLYRNNFSPKIIGQELIKNIKNIND